MARQMKDSGVEWIGEIPEGWSCGQLGKYVTVFNGDRSSNYPTPEELRSEGIPFFTSFDLNEDEILMHPEGKYLDRDKYERLGGYKCQIGDIVFCLRGSVGKCSINMRYSEGTVASSLMGIRCHSMDNKFVFYTLVSDVVGIQNDLLMNGTCAANLSAKNVCKYKVAVPPLFEQHRIAAFLDRRCAGIDAVIERTRATIEEYKKLKQAVITEAVTKGVRGPRPMKDSGIEWIGEIPEGWDIVKLKYFLSDDKVNLRVGPFGSALAGSDFVEEGKWVYNQRVVLDDNFISNDTFVSASKYAELAGFEVIPDDVLITTRGSIGKVAIVPQDAPRGILHPCIIKFRVNQDMIPHSILKHVFNDTDFVLRQIKEMSNSTTIDVLYSYSLRNVLLPLIPMCEQPEIAAYLDEKCAALDTLIAKKTDLLTELETYKKSLIYEYVTGKKEVQ